MTAVRCPKLRVHHGDKDNGHDSEFGVTVNVTCHVGHGWGPVEEPYVLSACTQAGNWTIDPVVCERKFHTFTHLCKIIMTEYYTHQR